MVTGRLTRVARLAAVSLVTLLLLGLSWLGAAKPASAQVVLCTWTGAAGDGQWTTGTNWDCLFDPATLGVYVVIPASTAPGTVVHYRDAVHTIQELTVGTGSTLIIESGTLTVAGPTSVSGNLTINGTSSTLALNSAATVANLNFSNGTVTGPGDLTISGNLDWFGGTMDGGGTTEVRALAHIWPGSAKALGSTTTTRTLQVDSGGGDLMMTDALTVGAGSTIHTIAGLTPAANGIFAIQADVDLTGAGTVQNDGYFGKDGSGGSAQSYSVMSANLLNNGTVNVGASTLVLQQGTANGSSSINVNPGATLEFATGAPGAGFGFWNNSALSNHGTVRWTGGTLGLFNTSTFNNWLDGTFEIAIGSTQDLSSNGPPSTEVARFLNYGTLRKTVSGVQARLLVPFDNARTVDLQAGQLNLGSGNTSTSASDTGSYGVAAGANLYFGGSSATVRVLDTGSSVTGAGQVSFSAGTVFANGAYTLSGANSGTYTVPGATVRFQAPATGGATVYNQGTMILVGTSGTPAGSMSASSFAQSATGRLRFDIFGPTAGSGYAQLTVGGTATLDGTLDIQTAKTYTPAPGTQFTLLNANPISGQFANSTSGFGVAYVGSPTPTSVVVTSASVNPAIKFSGETAPGGWIEPKSIVSLSATDTGGATISQIQYSLSSSTGPWTPYTGPFPVTSTNGTTQVDVYVQATDSLGITGTAHGVFLPWRNFPVTTWALSDGSAKTAVKGTLQGDANTTFNLSVDSYQDCPSVPGGSPLKPIGGFDLPVDASGQAPFDQTFNSAGSGVSEPSALALTLHKTGDAVSYSWCRLVSTPNISWLTASALTKGTDGVYRSNQYVVDAYQEKWFKVPVTPDGRINIKYTGATGSAIALHRNPNPFYAQLTGTPNGTQLAASAASQAFLPGTFMPGTFMPGTFMPGTFMPGTFMPGTFMPGTFMPGTFMPGTFMPGTFMPGTFMPGTFMPGTFMPGTFMPGTFMPGTFMPDAYSGAAARSMLAYSVEPDTSVHSIDRNTYDLLEDVYIRVISPYNASTPFSLEVTVEGGVCGNISQISSDTPVLASGVTPAGNSSHTLILYDSSRWQGSTDEKSAALSKLQTLAVRSEVAGQIIDLGSGKYPRVSAANAQADGNLACPLAKNIVASEIKAVVDKYWAANPSLEYIVLAGGNHDIPPFTIPDRAGLGYEKDYVPPVAPSTASEAGLAKNRVQTQDPYGSRVDVSRGDFTLAKPELAVGRLADTAADIAKQVDAYIAGGGVINPTSGLVTGYDPVIDGATEVKKQITDGLVPSDSLIQTPGTSASATPLNSSIWTADDLRTKLLGSKHDLVFLTGHFTAGNLLAADYATTLGSAEVAASAANFSNTLVGILGCHGGYTIPLTDALANASPVPYWTTTLANKGAAVVAGTGYVYADTELVEYGERFFVDYLKQLRMGTGPVSIGKALAAAKNQYLADTAQLSGMDEKTIAEMTLYGLPMMSVNFPANGRLGNTTVNPIAGPTTGEVADPGNSLGLKSDDVTVSVAPLSPHPKTLTDATSSATLSTTYYSGRDGVVANPFEPIFPKQVENVTVSGEVLRGAAFLGGSYTDLSGITPLTTSPDTENSRPHSLFGSDVFYPTQPFMANYFDALAGGPTRLFTIPAQYKSATPGATSGTLRTYSNMQFRLYYLPNANATEPAASAAAPTILSVAGVADGTTVTFSVRVQGEAHAGVQQVWVLYTGSAVSLYGQWQPLSLTQVAPVADPTLWRGSLALPDSASVSNLQFMAEAASGTGLVTLASNFGQYYTLAAPVSTTPSYTSITLDAGGSATLSSTSSTAGTYGDTATFGATLTSGGSGVSGQPVVFAIGGQRQDATTDGNGRASVTVPLVLTPGTYGVSASFPGTTGYQGSSASATVSIAKDGTRITGISVQHNPQPGAASSVSAVLKDDKGRAVPGKSVLFLMSGGGKSVYGTGTTDFAGRAVLFFTPPSGTYNVTVYFGQPVTVDSSTTIPMDDDFYGPSSATGTSAAINGAPANSPEGTAIALTAGVADPTAVSSYAWSVTKNGTAFASGTASSLTFTPDDNGTYGVKLTVTDKNGGTDTDSASITVTNVAPSVGKITAPIDPVALNTAISVSANFTDPGTKDTHTATWSWDDGTTSAGTVAETNGSGSVTGTHTYTAAGVYTVKLTVTDDDGGNGQSTFQYVVIYDPSAGFVTGGGWINSQAGAYTADPTLTGKATFGFVSKYQKGSSVPTGETDFAFSVANLSFVSTNYDWLVISGPKAQYKGSGTINGAGNYGFLLTAIDGQVTGGGGTDKFRIKIWDKTTSAVVYDNQAGASDTTDPTTVIAGGSIVIHSSSK